jgi:hypothetical protein
MEVAFGRRLGADQLAAYGLSNLRVTELSCRQVTCRLAYEYSKSVEDLLAANGLPRNTSRCVQEYIRAIVAKIHGRLELRTAGP